MQYLVSVIFDDKTNSATPAEMAAINAFNERIEAEGHWVFAGGLNSPSTATVIDNRSGEAMFTDGPSWRRRSTSPACGSSRPRTSTWRSSSPPRGRGHAIGRSRCGLSWVSERNRRSGPRHPEPSRSDRSRPADQSCCKRFGRRCRIGVAAFVGRMKGGPRGGHAARGDDPR